MDFVLPGHEKMSKWTKQMDTRQAKIPANGQLKAHENYRLGPRSLALFRLESRRANRTETGDIKVGFLEQLRRMFRSE